MKIVGIVQIYNEVDNGNLERCLKRYSELCDEIIVLDDASIDNPDEIVYNYTNHFYSSRENHWEKQLETANKSFLFEKAKKLNADWIFNFDADEIPEKKFTKKVMLKEIVDAESFGIVSLGFRWTHLWLSETIYRTDDGLNRVSPPRLYKNLGGDIAVVSGLHQRLWPHYADNPVMMDYHMIHYSSVNRASLTNKIVRYATMDKRMPYRLSKAKYLSVLNGVAAKPVKKEWFPDYCVPKGNISNISKFLSEEHTAVKKEVENILERIENEKSIN